MDRTAFDKLVLDHLDAMQRLAVRLTGSPDRAEELVQDALVRAIRSWRTFQGRSGFPTWMTRIVINAFRDGLAARAKPPLTRPRVTADVAGPFARAEAKDMAEHIVTLVSALPPRQREVLVLTAYQGFCAAEVAAMLDTTQQNVRTTLHHARQKLRDQLAAYLPEDQP